MKSNSKIVLTSAVAGAMAMGAMTAVIFPASDARAENAGASAAGSVNAGASTSTNNNASAGTLASSDTSTTTNSGGTTTNATSNGTRQDAADNEAGNSTETAAPGADTDSRMRQAETRQTGSRGSLTDGAGEAADGSNSAGGSMDTTLSPAASDDVDQEAAAESSADTDARLREAESRMSGSRGSLNSDTTAGADQNAELRDQIRNDPDAQLVEGDTDTPRNGGLLGLFRGSASTNVNAGASGTQIGASGELQ